jgi:hypothetical protein
MKADYLQKAYKIANDINEDIDCGESRQVLRKCIVALMDEMQRRHDERTFEKDAELIRQMKDSIRHTPQTVEHPLPYMDPSVRPMCSTGNLVGATHAQTFGIL